MNLVLFYIFGSVLVLLAGAVVLSRNPVYSAGYLVAALFLQAGIFAILGATFLAAIQVLVYAGAIMVLFLFVVMLIRLREEDLYRPRPGPIALAGAVVLFGEIALAIAHAGPPAVVRGVATGSIKDVGAALYIGYAIPLEVLSLLLLAAMVGAVSLARRRPT